MHWNKSHILIPSNSKKLINYYNSSLLLYMVCSLPLAEVNHQTRGNAYHHVY